MTPEEVTAELDAIASEADFAFRSDGLTERWAVAGAGSETIEPILRFMESHPDVDYGSPGPLAHFVERFYRNGYEDHLIQSIRRKPTTQTAWMLNRLINGTRDPSTRRNLIELMVAARDNANAGEQAKIELAHFISRLESS